MRRLLSCALLLMPMVLTHPAQAADGQIVKVLPHFLDREGRHALSPSLYERDAYQVQLRQHPEQRSGIRYDVQWKTKGGTFDPLKLRLELRGTSKGKSARTLSLEQAITRRGWLSQWTGLALSGQQYKDFGEVTAWRISLWEGEKLLDEQQSFLW